MSRHDRIAAPPKRRPRYLFSLVCACVLACAGLFGTHAPASAAGTFSFLPTIDLFPTVSWATGNDEYGSPGGPDPCNNGFYPGACPNGQGSLTGGNGIESPSAGNASGGLRTGVLDLDFQVSIPLYFHGLSFQYVHNRAAGIDTTIGRVTGAYSNPLTGHNQPTNTYIYPASNNDIKDTFQLSYGFKGVSATLGTFYRFRHDNVATADPANLAPADWHEQFLTLGYTAPSIAALGGATFGVSATGEYNHHFVSGNPNISPYSPLNNGSGLQSAAYAGYADNSGKGRWGINWGFNALFPISHGFAVDGSWSTGAFDFFDNSPVPFYYKIIDVGIVKNFNKLLTLTGDLNNLTQYNLGGVPFLAPNTIHRIYFALALDIHVAPNKAGGY